MKNLLLIAALTFGTLVQLAAQQNQTELIIRNFDNQSIAVYVDGYTYDDFNSSQTVYNLEPGLHALRVISETTILNPYRQVKHIILYDGPVEVLDGIKTRVMVTEENMLEQEGVFM